MEYRIKINLKSLPKIFIYIVIVIVVGYIAIIFGEEKLSKSITEIFENFDEDPGWEGYNNRVTCGDCPSITQDFGWRSTNFSGSGPGEIGGIIWRSTTPAYYAMPVGPFSFKDKLSASGKIAVKATADEAFGFYIGFFNSERQGWRVWSSCGFRIGEVLFNRARFYLDYKTGEAAGAILNPDLEIPLNGSIHTWELVYDPNARISDTWPDPRLPQFLDSTRSLHEDEVFERAKNIDPSITKEKLDQLLFNARDLGLVDDWYRKGLYHIWSIEKEAGKMKGKISFTFDDEPVVSYYLLPGHRDAPSDIDLFGIYNMQIYHGNMEFYVSDLVVNGKKIDLTHDPRWIGLNNKVSFVQDDFHAKQDFGYAQTNWAGQKPGEIGGRQHVGRRLVDFAHVGLDQSHPGRAVAERRDVMTATPRQGRAVQIDPHRLVIAAGRDPVTAQKGGTAEVLAQKMRSTTVLAFEDAGEESDFVFGVLHRFLVQPVFIRVARGQSTRFGQIVLLCFVVYRKRATPPGGGGAHRLGVLSTRTVCVCGRSNRASSL